MDVIILAAGENVRLQAVGLPPGMKPLMIVENEVLIRRLCRQARALTNGDIIIVCSPTNVTEVIFATQDYASHYVIQPKPEGPCDAVDRAIKLGDADDVMLLMGDNHIEEMPHIHNGYTPVVYGRRSNELALHPISEYGHFVNGVHAEPMFRWLGPVAFPKKAWHTGESWWAAALRDTTFIMEEWEGIRDMGVLR